jgi:hypothetical protein
LIAADWWPNGLWSQQCRKENIPTWSYDSVSGKAINSSRRIQRLDKTTLFQRFHFKHRDVHRVFRWKRSPFYLKTTNSSMVPFLTGTSSTGVPHNSKWVKMDLVHSKLRVEAPPAHVEWTRNVQRRSRYYESGHRRTYRQIQTSWLLQRLVA